MRQARICVPPTSAARTCGVVTTAVKTVIGATVPLALGLGGPYVDTSAGS
jgi:hypothetical protein